MNDAATSDQNEDPIVGQRVAIRERANRANRVAYLLLGAATVLFFVGLATGFPAWIVQATIATLVIGCIILALSIQVAYAIRGAERWDEDQTTQRRRR